MFHKIKRDSLDILFSKYIRGKVNGECECCQRVVGFERLETSHFHGRRKQSVRFDPENVAALCRGCHQNFTENPADHHSWFQKRLGEKRFNSLMIRANIAQKTDRKLIKIWLKTITEKDLI